MFKKSKNTNITPPCAPTLDEVFSDLATFQVDVPPHHVNNTNNKAAENGTAPVALESWWKIFEQFMVDLKCLEMVHSEVEGYKIKLESHKLEIETETKILKNEIEKQHNLIDVALE